MRFVNKLNNRQRESRGEELCLNKRHIQLPVNVLK